MKKSTVNTITFAQATSNKKMVVSNKYVAHAVFNANKPIWEALGGTRIEGEKGLCIEFPTVAKAKDFIAQAITHVSKSEYNKTRKTEPKAKVEPKKTAPASTKGKTAEFITLTDADGNKFQVPVSAITQVKATPTKAKGNTKPTTAPNAKASKSTKKAEKTTTPRKTKGNCPVDFSKLAGKGSAANKQAAALMRKAGIVDGTSAEYKSVWAEWCKVR